MHTDVDERRGGSVAKIVEGEPVEARHHDRRPKDALAEASARDATLRLDEDQRARLGGLACPALASSGHLLVIVHHPDSLGVLGPPDPDQLYTDAIHVELAPARRRRG